MRILNLLVCLLIIARANAANTWTSMIFSGGSCSSNGNPTTVTSIDGSTCVTVCGNYYKVNKAATDDVYTFTQYTDNACTSAPGATNDLTCKTGNEPATFATAVASIPRAQCVQSSTTAPTTTWTRFALTAGPSGDNSCPAAGVEVGALNTCQAGCGGSFKVNNLPAATSNMFTLVHYSDASCTTQTSETDFTCGAAGAPVDVGSTQYKIACNIATEAPTNSPTNTPTVTPTTGSASTVVFNITLLLAALLFALL